jgi:hypothetical protein
MKMSNWPWGQVVGETVISQTIVGGNPANLISFEELLHVPRLHNSALKVMWAAKQLEQIRARVKDSQFDSDYLSILRAELDEDSGYHILKISQMPDLREYCEYLSLTAADFLGNLRSSLEYLTWQFASEFCKGNPPLPRSVQFPICDTAADFTTSQSRLRSQLDSVAFAFIERYQPFHGIDGRHDSYHGEYIHQLAHLRELSNSEKHRLTELFLMLPTQVWFGTFNIVEIEEDAFGHTLKRMDRKFLGTNDTLHIGMPVLALRLNCEPTVIERAGSFIPHIAMSGQRPMIETLERILNFVHLILSDCARLP